jgi:hypothetical protein
MLKDDVTKLEAANSSIEQHTFLNKDFSTKPILKGFNLSNHLFKNCNFQGVTLIRI